MADAKVNSSIKRSMVAELNTRISKTADAAYSAGSKASNVDEAVALARRRSGLIMPRALSKRARKSA